MIYKTYKNSIIVRSYHYGRKMEGQETKRKSKELKR